ncbi:hypothetical protein CSB09_00475 [Candidatus Gracilibacteria bacterium]|nr:MAG: hypothetical protein CSB09_00475 [Candidatus Gracilibacteria bacterium]
MQKKSIDTSLVFLVLGLMVFGMVMISSVSVYSSFKVTTIQVAKGLLDEPHNAFYLMRNLMHITISLVMLTIFSKIPYSFFEKYAKVIYMISIVFLASVFFIGEEYNGAKGWISVPGIPLSLQPIEFVKIGLLIMLAFFVKRNRLFLHSFKKGFLPYFFYVGLVVLLLMLQPDFGSILILTPIVVGLYFVAGGNKRFIIISLILAFFGMTAIYGVGKFTDKSKLAYISQRVDNFFRSSQQITESRNGDQGDYQLKQGFIALGSGGFFGLGFGKSIQKFGYLPEVQGDFIFSVIVEELGFVGAFFLIFIYLAIVYRGFYIARSVKDLFGKYLAFSITLWIIVQTSINIGVNLNIIPLTGVTLPFVSYGGSSLISLSIAIGILLSISRHSEYKPQNLSDALQAKRTVIF